MELCAAEGCERSSPSATEPRCLAKEWGIAEMVKGCGRIADAFVRYCYFDERGNARVNGDEDLIYVAAHQRRVGDTLIPVQRHYRNPRS